MKHTALDRFNPTTAARHARLFELIRQSDKSLDRQSPQLHPTSGDSRLNPDATRVFRDLACKSLRRPASRHPT